MKPPDDLIETLNQIKWRKPAQLSSRAKDLMSEFLERMRVVIKALINDRGILPGEAFDTARTAGPHSDTHRALMAELFHQAIFPRAGVRETLIFPIVSYYSWDEDHLLSAFPNPWSPLMELYKMGYTSDFDISPDGRVVSIIIGYNDTEEPYRIV